MEGPPDDLPEAGWPPVAEEEPGEPDGPAAEVGKTFNVSESADFWLHRNVSVGSLIEVVLEAVDSSEEKPASRVALLVKSWALDSSGIWLVVKPIASEQDWAWQEVVRIFSRKKQQVHICHVEAGTCPAAGEPGLHIKQFVVFPPGVLGIDYADKKRKKDWEAALREFPGIPQLPQKRANPDERKDAGPDKGPTDRIEALRERLFSHRGGRPQSAPVRGAFPPAPPLGVMGSMTPAPLLHPLKLESGMQPAIEISDEESKKKRLKKDPRGSVAQSLSAAITKRAVIAKKEAEATKKKKKKKKKKARAKKKSRSRARHQSTSTTSSSSSGSGSSTDDLRLPPLQKKAQKRPGSVLKFLVNHITEALAQAAVEEAGSSGGALGGSTTKAMSYFQILLRPQIASKTRDVRELETLARSLDLLREGRVDELGDLISGRFIALENAALTGSWASAQWLEVAPSRVPGIAQTPLLLEAQRHSRLVDRAAGRNSWGRGRQGDSWGGGGKGGHDEKGKTKGGKGKGKGKKGKKSAWSEKPAEDKEEKAA